MNRLQKKILNGCVGLVGAMLGVMTQSATASPEQERMYLLQLMHQINAMQPTILAAEQAQSKTNRVQFHYTAYIDSEGQHHNSVWEDLQLIRQGIQDQLDHAPVEPRSVAPLRGDYRDNSVLPQEGSQTP